jgi:nucleotide-binding universal stress UspA family protein
MTTPHLFKEIACCTDFSDNAKMAFATARDLAARYGSRLHIVHVTISMVAPMNDWYFGSDFDAALVERASQAAAEMIEKEYVRDLPKDQPYSVHVLSGYPATTIVELAKEKEIDLIVMGSHGLTGVAHVLFGSTADRVVRKAPCSVLAVRPVEGRQG